MKILQLRRQSVIALLFLFWVVQGACKKYLDKISDDSFIIPTSVTDYQQLIDNELMYVQNSPNIQDYSSDDIYISSTQLNSVSTITRNTYLWASDIFEGQGNSDWNLTYGEIYYSNLTIEGLQKIQPTTDNSSIYNSVRGSALYFRGSAHYNLSQVFAKPYSISTASKDLGLPYKTSSQVDQKIDREPLDKFYQDIITDVKSSIPLLPQNYQSQFRNRPSKQSAYAMLARIYLSMSDYQHAESYADSTLSISNNLVDYNSIDPTSLLPFRAPYISEVICLSSAGYYILRPSVDSTLYNSYDTFDLRKTIFFMTNTVTGSHDYKASYGGLFYPFTGPAIDEVNLILAECLARRNKQEEALSVLNNLLALRYKTGKYIPHTSVNTPDVLSLILKERRKELIFRGLRWTDLRRLNLEGGNYAISLSRNVDGIIYTLKPNDVKYIFPIPPDELKINPMEQNPR